MILVKKGLLALLALVVVLALALHVGIGCGAVQAAVTMEASCCGNNCPMGPSVGASACCNSQDSESTSEEVSKPSVPGLHPLVGLTRALIIPTARLPIEQICLFQGSPPGAAKLALFCSRQI